MVEYWKLIEGSELDWHGVCRLEKDWWWNRYGIGIWFIDLQWTDRLALDWHHVLVFQAVSLAWNRPPLKPVVYPHSALWYGIVFCWDWRDLCRCVPIDFWLWLGLEMNWLLIDNRLEMDLCWIGTGLPMNWRRHGCGDRHLSGLAPDCDGLTSDWHRISLTGAGGVRLVLHWSVPERRLWQ